DRGEAHVVGGVLRAPLPRLEGGAALAALGEQLRGAGREGAEEEPFDVGTRHGVSSRARLAGAACGGRMSVGLLTKTSVNRKGWPRPRSMLDRGDRPRKEIVRECERSGGRGSPAQPEPLAQRLELRPPPRARLAAELHEHF